MTLMERLDLQLLDMDQNDSERRPNVRAGRGLKERMYTDGVKRGHDLQTVVNQRTVKTANCYRTVEHINPMVGPSIYWIQYKSVARQEAGGQAVHCATLDETPI